MNELLLRILSDFSGVKFDQINDESKLLEDLNIESIAFVDLVIEIERTANIKIDFSNFAINLFELNDLTYSQIKVKNIKECLTPYFPSL